MVVAHIDESYFPDKYLGDVPSGGMQLDLDWFQFRVNLIVDGKEMLGIAHAVIDLSHAFLGAILACKQRGEATLELMGTSAGVMFAMRGSDVVVTSGITGNQGRVTLHELDEAGHAFHRHVGEFLYRIHPELRTHPRWGGHMQSWFPELEVLPSQQPSRRERRAQRKRH